MFSLRFLKPSFASPYMLCTHAIHLGYQRCKKQHVEFWHCIWNSRELQHQLDLLLLDDYKYSKQHHCELW